MTNLEDGRCSFSNNLSENSIRPVTVDQKNWLFSDTSEGVQSNTLYLAIVEMAKAYGLDLYELLFMPPTEGAGMEINMGERIQFIAKRAKKYTWELCIMLLIILITTYLVALFPYFLGRLVDMLFYDKNVRDLVKIVLAYILIFLVNQLLHFALQMLHADLQVRFIYDIKSDIYKKVLSYNCEYLTSMNTGDIIYRINHDADQVMALFYSDIFYGVSAVFDCVICTYIVLTISWELVWVVLTLAVFSFLTGKYFSNKVKILQKRTSVAAAKNASWLFELLNNMRDVRLLGATKNGIRRYLTNEIGIIRLETEKRKSEVAAEQGDQAIRLVCMVGLYIVSALLIFAGHLTLGGMIASIDYFNRITVLIGRVSVRFVTLPERLVAVDRIMDIWKVDSEDSQSGIEVSGCQGNIKIKDLSFSYDKKRELLKNINLDIKAGEKIAIVGKSGEGKSTIANLLCRLYEPQQGSIAIDGIEIREMKLHCLRRQVGIVHQDAFLFDDTIRYNLIFSNSMERDEELWEMLKKVSMYDYVKSLPKGLDAPVGAEGSFLSGGQKQRLIMARVFLRNPSIIIMDEATSALDSKTEMEIVESWNYLFSGKTMLMIAHRFSSVKYADKIICIQNGECVGFDTHENLMSCCEAYRELYTTDKLQDEY